MAFPLYADSIGGIGQMLYARDNQRQAASQAALQQLLGVLSQAQQQKNLEARNRMVMEQAAADEVYRQRKLQMELAEAASLASARAATDRREERKLDLMDRLYKDQAEEAKKPPQPTPKDLVTIINTLRESGRPIPKELYARAGEFGNALAQSHEAEDAATMQEYRRGAELAEAGNRMLRIKEQAGELAKSQARESWYFPFSTFGMDRQHPLDRSREMLARMKPIMDRFAPLLDTKAGYVTLDPVTGRYVNARRLPASIAAEYGPPVAGAAPAAPQMPLPFYDEVNKLIGQGVPPAEAKRLVLQQLMTR